MIANRDDYLEKLMVFRGRNHIGASYKYYYADPGLRNARLDFLHRDDGHIMENIIYNELIYRGNSVQIGVVEAYGKDALNKTTQSCLETDFAASRGGGYYCMRSAWSLDSLLKEEHKRRSLFEDQRLLQEDDYHTQFRPIRRDIDGLTYIGIEEFLLNLAAWICKTCMQLKRTIAGSSHCMHYFCAAVITRSIFL